MSEIKSPWPGPKGMIPVTSARAEDDDVYRCQGYYSYMPTL